MKKLHPWLRLMRISNLPTCITNVMTGCGLGILSLPSEDPGPWIDPVRFGSCSPAVRVLPGRHDPERRGGRADALDAEPSPAGRTTAVRPARDACWPAGSADAAADGRGHAARRHWSPSCSTNLHRTAPA